MGLGQAVRKRRKEQGLTLDGVAVQAGLTAGALSQIERDLVNPTVPTLRRIANALKVPVFTFLMDPQSDEQIVVRQGGRRTYTLKGANVAYQVLSPHTRRVFEVERFTLAPGGSTAEEPLMHSGEEFCLVLRGTMRLELGDQEYLLRAGDSAQFDCGIPHRYVNAGEETAEAISAMSPPFS